VGFGAQAGVERRDRLGGFDVSVVVSRLRFQARVGRRPRYRYVRK
jgi:hypothetical protein